MRVPDKPGRLRYTTYQIFRGHVMSDSVPNVAVLSGMRDETNGERLMVCAPDPLRGGKTPACLALTPDALALYKYEPTDDPVTCTRCITIVGDAF